MQQVMIRQLDPDLAARLREVAAQENLSLNKAAQLLMRRGAGLDAGKTVAPGVAEAVGRYLGKASPAETERVQAAIDAARAQDRDLQP